MFGAVSSWLGATKPSDDEDGADNKQAKEKQTEADKDKQVAEGKGKEGEAAVEGEQADPQPPDLNELGNQALSAAKEWGGYLFNVGKAATKTVANTAVNTAKSVKTLGDQTILGDFAKEQEAFVNEKKEKVVRSEAAVAPWVGYHEQDSMKEQILALSQDKRNFLRNPPKGVQFHFDFDTSFPVAVATLAEDENLQRMRFDLVPKQVTEENFWRNYFYRVSLIKQSAQLTTLAQQTGEEKSSGSSRRSSTGEAPSPVPSGAVKVPGGAVTADSDSHPGTQAAGSPPENEFVSDTFQVQYTDEELKREMQQLGVASAPADPGKSPGSPEEWERELQAELNDYELVTDDKDLDDDLENELLKEIEAEATGTK